MDCQRLPSDPLCQEVGVTMINNDNGCINADCIVALRQGNALKTILPMATVIDPEHGQLTIDTLGKRHTIRCGCDAISQRAVVHRDVVDVPNCKKRESRNGTIKQGL